MNYILLVLCLVPALFKRSFLFNMIPAFAHPLFGCAMCFGFHLGWITAVIIDRRIVDLVVAALAVSAGSYGVDHAFSIMEELHLHLQLRNSSIMKDLK